MLDKKCYLMKRRVRFDLFSLFVQHKDLSCVHTNMGDFFKFGICGARLGFCVMSSSIFLLSSCDPGEKEQPPPALVSVVQPQLADVPVWREWVGTLTGTVNASIVSQVDGYVKSQDYANGASVKRGDVLFRIDDSLFRDTLDQATAKLAEAKAQWQQAEYNKNLYKPLAVENVVSKQQYENAVLSSQAAQANILAAQAEVNLSQRNVDYTVVVSPIDGIAGIATVQVGDLVSPSAKVLTTVSSVSPIFLNFAVTEKEWLGQTGSDKGVQQGSKVDIIMPTEVKYPQQAEVVAIDRAFDSSTGTVLVQAQVSNDRLLLRPGMFVRVRALIDTQRDVLIVPQKAIYSTQGRFFIVTLDASNKPHMIPVTTGASLGDQIAIKALVPNTVSADSRVVVSGLLQAIRASAKGDAAMSVVPAQEENN